MIPPMTRPVMTGQRDRPMVATNVAVTVAVTKNSATLAEPIANRAVAPRPIRVVVTIAPQPPPPIASRNPPSNPTMPTCFGVQCSSSILPEGAPQDHRAHHQQVRAHDRADAVARHCSEDVGTDGTAEHPRHGQTRNQFAIDIPQPPMRCPRRCRCDTSAA